MILTIYIDIGMRVHGGLSLGEAAKQVGVSPITLRRWLLEGRVAEVSRNRNGWRVFMQDDIDRIKAYAQRLILPGMSK